MNYLELMGQAADLWAVNVWTSCERFGPSLSLSQLAAEESPPNATAGGSAEVRPRRALRADVLGAWDQMLAPLGPRAAAGSILARPGGPASSGLRKARRPPSLTALCVPATASSGIR